MATCYNCSATLNRRNDSWEHLIPFALGGELKSKRLLCRHCNNRLGKEIDRSLVRVCKNGKLGKAASPASRAAVKIMLNFFLWKCKSTTEVLDAIRFIRGEHMLPVTVKISSDTPFTNVHTITLRGKKNQQTIHGYLVLFNRFTFEVILSNTFTSADFEISYEVETTGFPNSASSMQSDQDWQVHLSL